MMNTFAEKIFILDPTGLPAQIATVKPADRPKTLEGVAVALVDITKPNSDIFLQRLEEQLRSKYPTMSFVHYRKGGSAGPLDEKTIVDIVQDSDFAMIAVAD